MARKKANELAAGLFVIACGTAIVAVIVWLGGMRFGGQYVYVTAPLESGDISIAEGSLVKLGPVEVGKVDRVKGGDDWKDLIFRVRLSRPVDIRSDAVIESTPPTLGGLGSLIVLHRGSGEAPQADDNHPVRLRIGPNPIVRDLQRQIGYGKDEQTAFQAVLASLASIVTSLDRELSADDETNIMSNVRAAIVQLRQTAAIINQQVEKLNCELDARKPASLLAKTHDSLDNVRKATGEMSALMVNVRPQIERAASRTASAAERIDEYAQADLAELLKSARAGADQLLDTLGDLREVSSTAKDIVTLNRDNIDETISNLTQVSVNLKAASRDIRRHPWKLLGESKTKDIRSENIQNAAESFAEAARQLDDAIGRMKGISSRTAQAAGKPITAAKAQIEQLSQKIGDSYENFTRAERALWNELAK
ncbi:MAG: hypothetical protein HQ546_10330 [Planctomycetes bacterium]|nr:hypothetical protein [Planctomycetota bacterium]